ncbi:hypothetical protein SAMN02800694_2390 [Luteibacter sp. UNCMF331Sha3.1]|jgi:hypothetical protein|uniref:hypothetical protein n=1 Tax=Luteibacter sp. UNCMF331Sha3.1 TaxID=1502760 RepID=UPI0008C471A8|nr:hypothetical protein [Luteibacter sp. UNCMF331Sha3.1]SEM98826.1 hypothetical protein SAMN02800694_2390 [Luteibacter sp. UNCMF331Sha3.1]
MSPERFVQALQKVVVHDNLAVYSELFRSTPVDRAVDPHWVRALTLFNGLDDENKQVLIEIICHTMVDTTANILGILDGGCPVAGIDGDVTVQVDGHRIGGELQELFLELSEAG